MSFHNSTSPLDWIRKVFKDKNIYIKKLNTLSQERWQVDRHNYQTGKVPGTRRVFISTLHLQFPNFFFFSKRWKWKEVSQIWHRLPWMLVPSVGPNKNISSISRCYTTCSYEVKFFSSMVKYGKKITWKFITCTFPNPLNHLDKNTE